MEGKLETKYYKLEKLVKWDQVDKVNEMLMAGVSPHVVSAWCKERGFSISHPKLYEYKDILQEAIVKEVTVERLLGIGTPKRSAIILQALGVESAKNLVKNDIEVLDLIIQKGYSSLLLNPEVGLADAMKAIEMKYKLTGGSHGGLTTYGLDQLRNLEEAKLKAIIEVVLEFLPEDKHEALYDSIEQAERRFYEEQAPEYLDQYEKAMQDAMDDENNRVVYEKKNVSDAQIVYTDF